MRADGPRSSTRIRFGGMRTPRGYLFELTGGRLCLDFANTLDERGAREPRELLTRYADLLDWGLQSGALTREQAGTLRAHAAAHAASAERTLRRVRLARETIFGIFSAAAHGLPVPARLLRALNRLLAPALRRRVVDARGGEFRWGWRIGRPAELDRPVWPAIWSAAELLVSGDLGMVRQCDGAGCAWLFIDSSRNGSRRWCDMSVCGNRAKARRHYAKSKRREGSGSGRRSG